MNKLTPKTFEQFQMTFVSG